MSDPKVPNTSDSESTTISPPGKTKLESAPSRSDSPEPPTLLDVGRSTSDSDASTILAPPPPTRGPAASDAPTLLDARMPDSPLPPPRPISSTWQLPALPPGMLLAGRYEILQTIGQGGMGAVYKAEDRELGRTVALKVIRPELASNPDIRSASSKRSFSPAKLRIVTSSAFTTWATRTGSNSSPWSSSREMTYTICCNTTASCPPTEAVEIMEQVVSGLRAANRVGVIHRDLKPGNIMRASDGRVLVMDFGLARYLQGDGMTQTERCWGRWNTCLRSRPRQKIWTHAPTSLRSA